MLLREFRRVHDDMSQEQLASELGDGITQTRISDWETGRRRPNLKAGSRIAEYTLGAVPAGSWFLPPVAVGAGRRRQRKAA